MSRLFVGVLAVLVLVLIFPVFAANGADARDETIALGGPRNAKTTISLIDGKFTVVIEMRPVSCFDDTTNADVNRTMAESYALAAFCRSSFGKARQLASSPLLHGQIEALFKGVLVDAAGLEGGKYRLRLSIPEDGIQPRHDVPMASKPFDRSSPLFTRYGDHETTIRALEQALDDELARVVKGFAGASARKGLDAATVEALRFAGVKRFTVLRGIVQDDNLLLDTTERPELLEKVSAAEQEWNREVDACVKSLTVDK